MGRIIALGIIIIGLLAYFNIDLHAYVKDIPVINKIWDIGAGAWYSYIKPLGEYLFTSIAGLFK